MEDIIVPIGVLSVIAAGIGYFVKTMTDYRLKKKLIEKDLVNADASNLVKNQDVDSKLNSLKWGLIILFGGLGLIIIHYVDYYRDSPLPFGIVAVTISLGFLAYYFLAEKLVKK